MKNKMLQRKAYWRSRPSYFLDARIIGDLVLNSKLVPVHLASSRWKWRRMDAPNTWLHSVPWTVEVLSLAFQIHTGSALNRCEYYNTRLTFHSALLKKNYIYDQMKHISWILALCLTLFYISEVFVDFKINICHRCQVSGSARREIYVNFC